MKLILCGASLYPMPISRILHMAKNTGFDGVEIFLFGKWTRDKVSRVLDLAEKLNLTISFHQVWSTNESSSGITWRDRILTALGQLPGEGYNLDEIVPVNARPLVAYADCVIRHPETIREGYWVQSVPTGVSYEKSSYTNFEQSFRMSKFPIVMDTQHLLEYISGRSGITNIIRRDSEGIHAVWEKFLNTYSGSIEEIHFNDLNPALGDTNGRNLFPGTGIAPLKAFAATLKSARWDGSIVPEVQPKFILYRKERLMELRREVESYFA
jgi:hypothetical protein